MNRRATLSICLAAVTLATAGCSATGQGGGSDHVSVDARWQADDARDAWIELDDGKVSGNDGCNTLSGEYTTSGDRIDFTSAVTTRKFCEGVDLSFSSLGSGTVDGDSLTLLDTSGAELTTLTRSS